MVLPAVLVALAAGPLVAPAAAQEGPVISVVPGTLQLRDAAAAVEVRVDGAAAATGYQVELAWDPAVVAVTAIAPGEFLASRGGQPLFTPRFLEPGRLALGAVLTDSPQTGNLPGGGGVLAYVTLAPLSAGTSVVEPLNGSLVDEAGEAVAVAQTVAGSLEVLQPPPEAVSTAAVAQATALADELGAGGGGGGGLDLPSLDRLPRPGSDAIWVGLMLLALLVVFVGWLVGRQPPPAEPPLGGWGGE